MKIVNTWIFKLTLLFAVVVFMPAGSEAQKTAVKLNTITTETEAEDPYESKFFRVRGAPHIIVKTIDGDISVIENSSLGGVQVDLYVERSFSLWSGTRSLDNFRIVIMQQRNQIIASVEDRRSGSSRHSRDDVRFHFVVQVPEKASAELRTVHGEILLEGVEGRHFVQNQSGAVNVKSSTGEIRAVSTLGNIELSDLDGHIFAKTVNGHIYIDSISGEVRARTVTGNIFATGMSGTFISATTSGNITAEFENVSEGIYMETISGDINLLIPSDFGYDIVGNAMRFDFAGINESSISEQSQTFRERKLVIRNGSLPVQLSTVSGLIRVSELY